MTTWMNMWNRWRFNIDMLHWLQMYVHFIVYVTTWFMLQANIKTCYSCYIHLYSNVPTRHTVIGKLLVMNRRDLKAYVVEPLQARFLPLNTMSSVGFYGPSTATVSPVFHYPYHFVAGQYISPEMYSFHPHDKDILTVLPGYVSQCHHSALPGMSHYNTDNEKPTQSYIGLIGKAILSSPQQKLVLGDIYNYILTNYPYFRNKGPGWRNSIRHNLSLNDCFVKVGRSPNGKGHFWAISPANYDDFSRGDYKRKRASRRNGELISTTERCSKEKCAAGKDKRSGRDVSYYESRKIHLNVERGTSESQKRGFHIETLLSN